MVLYYELYYAFSFQQVTQGDCRVSILGVIQTLLGLFWSNISSWPCLIWGGGPDDLQSCIQTSATLWITVVENQIHNTESVSWCSDGISCISVCCPHFIWSIGYPWTGPGSVLFAPSLQVFLFIDRILHAEQIQLFQSFLIADDPVP